MAFGRNIAPVTVTLYVISIAVIIIAPVNGAAYSTCTSTSQQFQGYTYALDGDTGAKVWTHCAFQNPIGDHALCGRPETSTTNYVCDPDGLLTSVAKGDEINAALTKVQTKISTVCTDPQGTRQSYIVGVVLIDRIRRPDLRSTDLCINDCGELQPELNETVYNVTTEAEQDAIMENFGDGIRNIWQLGACGNDVIIFYCRQLNEVYISVGSQAAEFLTDSKVQSLSEQFMVYVNDNRLEDGLLFVAEQIRNLFWTLTPAHILLISGMLVTLMFGTGLAYYVFIYEDMNHWKMNKPLNVLEWLAYLCSGLWLIKGTIMFMFLFSNKVPYWGIGVLLAISVASFLVYGLDRGYLSNWEDNPLRLGHMQ